MAQDANLRRFDLSPAGSEREILGHVVAFRSSGNGYEYNVYNKYTGRWLAQGWTAGTLDDAVGAANITILNIK